MPILPREPNVHPPELFSNVAVNSNDHRWWVAQTMARQEKGLARHLLGKSIAFYLPLASKSRKVSGRNRVSHIPLFSGYVFFFGSDDDRIAALTSNVIVNLLPVPDTEQMTADLRRLEQVERSGAEVQLESRLGPGRPVRILTGPLMGIEGVVSSLRGENRLILAVTFLRQGASLLIDDYKVEPI
jgi:transcription antitermination factor NusG